MFKHIKGFIAAPLTGFNPDGSVNLEIIPRYAAMLHSNGIVGVFVNGTTGEGPSLTFKERLALAEKWVDSAPEELCVIIHVGYADKSESRDLAVHAEEIGADGIGEIGPNSLKLTCVKELVEYSKGTASSVPRIPYYYYHIPSINNLDFPMIEFLALAYQTIQNLAGIKYTHENMSDYKRCIEFKNGRYDILFGRDEYLVDGLKAGAMGAIGSTYNIMAPLYHEIVKTYKSNDLETAQQLQTISAETCRLLYKTGSFRCGLKIVMKKIGLDMGEMRHPQESLSSKIIKELESTLESSGMCNFLNKM